MKTSRTYTMAARAEVQYATARRILETARSAFENDPYEQVTLDRIAKAANVSHQTVLNHFTSKQGLFSAVVAEITKSVDEHRSRAVPGDPRSALSVLVDDYERIGDSNTRLEPLEERFAEVAEAMAKARAYHRAWLEWQFARWLDVPPRERKRRLALLSVATDVKTWKQLRRHLGLDRRTTQELMLRLVECALGESPSGQDGRSEPI